MNINQSIETYCSSIRAVFKKIDLLYKTGIRNDEINEYCTFISKNIDLLVQESIWQATCPSLDKLSGVSDTVKSSISSFASKYKLTESALLAYYQYALLQKGDSTNGNKTYSNPERLAMVYYYRDRRDRFECNNNLIKLFTVKIMNENENGSLLTQLKPILVQIIQKGYSKVIIDLINSYLHNYESYEDCYFLLILDELQSALKSLLSLYKLIRISKEELLQFQAVLLALKPTPRFASISSLVYSVMIQSVVQMPPFSPSLTMVSLQPNLFDPVNLTLFLTNLQERSDYSLLLIVTVVSAVEYSAVPSTPELLSQCFLQNEILTILNSLHGLSFVSSSELQSDCYQVLLEFIQYCIRIFLNYPTCFPCEAVIREQLQERHLPTSCMCDGIETFVQCIQHILAKAVIPKACSILFECMLALIQMVDREPRLFDTAVQYISSLARVSMTYQREVYTILQHSSSAFISLNAFFTNLDLFFNQLSSLSTSTQLREEDAKGMEAILAVFAALIHHNPTIRDEIMTRTQHQLVSLLMKLLPFSFPLSFMATLFSLLKELAEERRIAMAIWSELSRNLIIYNTNRYNTNCNHVTSGLELIFTSVELEQGEYACTASFVAFFNTLLKQCDFTTIASTSVFLPYLSFIFHTVLRGCYYHQNHAYKNQILMNCLRILHYCVQQTIATSSQVLMSLIADLLSSSQLMNIVLNLQTIDILPYPSLTTSRMIESNDAVVEMNLASSELILELLTISSSCIEENHITLNVPGITKLVQPLAQQLLLNPAVFMKILLRVENSNRIELQLVTLKIFFQVIQQIPTATLLSFFENYPQELDTIHDILCSMFVTTILHHSKGAEYQCCMEVLNVLTELASHSSSLLLKLIPLDNPHSLVNALQQYVESIEFLYTYTELAGRIFCFLSHYVKLVSKETATVFDWLQPSFLLTVFSNIHHILNSLTAHQFGAKSQEAVDSISIQQEPDVLLYHTLDCMMMFTNTVYFLVSTVNQPSVTQRFIEITLVQNSVFSLLQSLRPILHRISLSAYSSFFQNQTPQSTTVLTFWSYSIASLTDQSIREYSKQFSEQHATDIQEQLLKERYHMNKAKLIKVIQDSLVDHYLQLLYVLIIDIHDYAPELVHSFYTALLEVFNQSSLSTPTQIALARLLLLLLLHCKKHSMPLSMDLLRSSIECVAHSLANETAIQCDDVRSVLYYYLLNLFTLYSDTATPTDMPFLHMIEVVLPSLLSLLVHDLSNQTAILLLHAILSADPSSSVIQYLTSQTDLIMRLLQALQAMDITLLTNDAAFKTYQLQLTLLLQMASSTHVSMLFLQMSIFASINHSALFTTIKQEQNPLFINQCSVAQKDALRSVLNRLLQIAIVINQAVHTTRSIQIELTSFVTTLLPFISFIFKDKEGSQELSLRLIGSFVGVLVILADAPQRFNQAMNGYENVIRSEIVSLLNVISKKEKICNAIHNHIKKGGNDELSPFLLIIENSLLFMSKMGWKIGDEFLRAFGVKFSVCYK